VQAGWRKAKNYFSLKNDSIYRVLLALACTYFFVQVAPHQPRSFPSFSQPSGKLREKFPLPKSIFPKTKNGALK
jgi:hypothetical protein